MTKTDPDMHAAMKPSALNIERLSIDSAMKDFEALAAIQAGLATVFRQIEAGARTSSTGFLISAYKPEQFVDFIRRDGILLCARSASTGEPLGYLLGNSGATFHANHPTTTLHWDDTAAQAQYGAFYSAGRFTYLDQIGVQSSLQGSGVARGLHERFLNLVGKPILAAIVQEPIQNTRSTLFFKKLGYQQIGTFHTAEFKGLKDVRSAVLALPEDGDALGA